MKNITKENIGFREREIRLANENDKETIVFVKGKENSINSWWRF